MAEALDLESLIQSNAAAQKEEIARQAEEQAAFNEQAKQAMQSAREQRQPEYEKLQQQQAAVAEVQPPKLERPPTAPNTQEMLRPTSLQKQFGMASIFALMSVGIAKGSAIYGLKALGGFMEGAHASNVEQASAALKDYNAKMEEVRATNEAALGEYNAIFNNKKYSLEVQERMFRIKALEFNDELAMQTMSQQGMNATHRLLQQRATVDQKMADDLLRTKQIEESMQHHRAMEEIAKAKAAGGADNVLGVPIEDIPATPAGQKNEAFLQMLPPAQQEIVRRVASGDLPVSGMGNFGVKERAQYLKAAALYDPQYEARISRTIDKTKLDLTPGGPVGANVLSINAMPHHIADFAEAYKALDNSQIQRWNSTKNKLATEFGDPALNRVRVSAKAISDEMARMLKGGRAAPTQEEMDSWEKVYTGDLSKAQLDAVVWQSLQTAGGRLSAIEESVERETRQPYNAIFPETRAIIQRYKPANVPAPPWLTRNSPTLGRTPQFAPQAGGQLTLEQSITILKEAGGDKAKARELARQRGYKF